MSDVHKKWGEARGAFPANSVQSRVFIKMITAATPHPRPIPTPRSERRKTRLRKALIYLYVYGKLI